MQPEIAWKKMVLSNWALVTICLLAIFAGICLPGRHSARAASPEFDLTPVSEPVYETTATGAPYVKPSPFVAPKQAARRAPAPPPAAETSDR